MRNFNEDILEKQKLYLSALSGGADSTALLLSLIERGYHVDAVHCNFHLRGEESNRDEEFCKKLCADNGVKLHIAHFDTVAFASLHHQSIETAARNLRYNYFFQLAHDIGAAGVCVAHNSNDQAETLLMNLVRGAGIHGLSGMKAVNVVNFANDKVSVLRPMLGISRKEIVDYLNQRNQSWVTDSTNLQTDATRNKFRLEVMPLLEKINPSAIKNLASACQRLQSVEDVYDKAIDESLSRCVTGSSEKHISISALMREVSPESVLFEAVNSFGFNGSQVRDVLSHMNESVGREWTSNTHRLVVDRDDIIIVPIDDSSEKEFKIPEEGTYVISDSKKLRIKTEEWSSTSVIPRSNQCVAVDAGQVHFPLVLRPTKTGDRFVPFGMRGSKLISDFLTDAKLSLIEKRRQMVLVDATGMIIWVVGLRPDNRCRITPSTAKVLRLELLSK